MVKKAAAVLTTTLLQLVMFYNYQIAVRPYLCAAAFVPLPRRPLLHFIKCSRRSNGTTFISASTNTNDQDSTSSSSSSSSSSTSTCTAKEEIDQKRQQYRRFDLDGQSLIDETVAGMQTDEIFLETSKKLATLGQKRMSLEERKHRRRALDTLGIPNFRQFIAQRQSQPQQQSEDASLLDRKPTTVFQLNIGLYCNQACNHCHVESSPQRTEAMTAPTAVQCLHLLKNSPEVTTLDITGGAPELNPNFRFIVQTARALRDDLDIIDRCNLSVLLEPGQADLVDFLKDHRVHVIASLPCYSKKNVDMQRGKGVFERSIAALIKLNEAGYGDPNTGLVLDLVYNPSGAFLPPRQDTLEQQYKAQLQDNYGIVFNNLFTLTNMPIKRFADFLHRQGQMESYMDLLVKNFNMDTLNNVMCRNYVSVGYDGKVCTD
jgi:radical SAM/Cys-rich protein